MNIKKKKNEDMIAPRYRLRKGLVVDRREKTAREKNKEARGWE